MEWGTMGVKNGVTEETSIGEYDREVGPNKQMQMMMHVVDDCFAGSGKKKTYTAGDWIQDPLSEFIRAIGIGLEIKTALSIASFIAMGDVFVSDGASEATWAQDFGRRTRRRRRKRRKRRRREQRGFHR